MIRKGILVMDKDSVLGKLIRWIVQGDSAVLYKYRNVRDLPKDKLGFILIYSLEDNAPVNVEVRTTLQKLKNGKVIVDYNDLNITINNAEAGKVSMAYIGDQSHESILTFKMTIATDLMALYAGYCDTSPNKNVETVGWLGEGDLDANKTVELTKKYNIFCKYKSQHLGLIQALGYAAKGRYNF